MSNRNHGRRPGGGRGRHESREQVDWVGKFKIHWVTSQITKDTVDFARDFGKDLKDKNFSNSQIRNVYGELKRIELKGYENEKTSFLLLKPKVAYANSRQNNTGMNNFKNVFDKAYESIDCEKSFSNFMQIMEAILAYHKSFGGK